MYKNNSCIIGNIITTTRVNVVTSIGFSSYQKCTKNKIYGLFTGRLLSNVFRRPNTWYRLSYMLIWDDKRLIKIKECLQSYSGHRKQIS